MMPELKGFTDLFQNTTIVPNELIGEDATVNATLDELDQLLTMIFAQPETARHLCRKFYRYFMYYDITPEIEQDIIVPLANTFQANNYNVQPVLQQLFASQHFYDADNAIADDDNHGAIIKSPLDLVTGILRFFKIALPDPGADLESFYDSVRSGILSPMQDQGWIFMNHLKLPDIRPITSFPDTTVIGLVKTTWLDAINIQISYLMESKENGGFGWTQWLILIIHSTFPIRLMLKLWCKSWWMICSLK